MRIVALELQAVRVNRRGDWLFVQVHTDAGLTGVGEASHGGSGADRDELVAGAARRLAPYLIGHDPRAVRALVARLAAVADGFAAWTALSGIEQALWDLAGQAAGQPVYRLLGGPVRQRVPVYANINRATTDRTPAGFARSAEAAVADGFRAVKCAPLDGVDPGGCRDGTAGARVRLAIDRVAAVRAAVGPRVEVYVDCHQRLDLPAALSVAGALGALGVTWFEEPIPMADRDGLARLRAETGLEIIGGEHLLGPAAAWPYLAGSLLDTIMPDVKHCGGISGLLAIGELAAAASVRVAPHNPSGPVAMAATLQAVALLPTCRALEYAWGEVPWRANLVSPPEMFDRGAIALPTGPGLGVRLDPATLAAHAIAPGAD